MLPENKIFELAEAYINNQLGHAEKQELEARMKNDSAFARSFEEALALLQSLQNRGTQLHFRASLKQIQKDLQKIKDTPVKKNILLRAQYWRTAGVAAAAALITSLSAGYFTGKSNNTQSGYSELKKVRTEIEDIKQSQNRIIKDLDRKANKPAIENKYSGTGFALSNDGYIITNYHVTEGADSLYVQTHDGNYYKAFTVSFDAQADIAILKVEQKNFKFSKQGHIPYSFAAGKSKLGERIFTLGYPQDEIVYNEGYISSENGYQGNTMQYRLELPAEPGQSGAPVLDANGSIIAIVSGKESKSAGTTYAVSSATLLKLIKNIPQANNIALPKTNKLAKLNRSQQIEKLQDFTCVINVYK